MWDWPVRIVHWAMVLLLIALLTTAKVGGNAMAWHMRAGEAMLALVLFRIIWGFAGSRYARFASFVRGPRAVFAYAALDVPAAALSPTSGIIRSVDGWSSRCCSRCRSRQERDSLPTTTSDRGTLARLISKDPPIRSAASHRRNAWIVARPGHRSYRCGAVPSLWAEGKPHQADARRHQDAPCRSCNGGRRERNSAKAAIWFAACAAAVWWLVSHR